ncbi:acyl-CoA N-acyltransferase, partial [Echria macrotheca]
MSTPTIRRAVLDDIPTILSLIRAAAAEQAPNAIVEATEASLAATLHLSNPTSELGSAPTPRFAYPFLIISPEGSTAGLAIYLYNFSTWMARPGICLEELYVLPEYRRMGYARHLIHAIAEEAQKAGCSKMEWVCLRGNENALRFYESLGAKQMENWVVLKVGREGIQELCA